MMYSAHVKQKKENPLKQKDCFVKKGKRKTRLQTILRISLLRKKTWRTLLGKMASQLLPFLYFRFVSRHAFWCVKFRGMGLCQSISPSKNYQYITTPQKLLTYFIAFKKSHKYITTSQKLFTHFIAL